MTLRYEIKNNNKKIKLHWVKKKLVNLVNANVKMIKEKLI